MRRAGVFGHFFCGSILEGTSEGGGILVRLFICEGGAGGKW